MPSRFWKYPCCSASGGSRTCSSHQQTARESRWELGMHEAMYRYQLHLGWRPIGPHRALGDPLFHAVAVSCATCEGNGLIDRSEGASYSICGSCYGFGSRPLPGTPEIDAIRRRVGKAFPAALTEYDPATAVRQLFNVLSGAACVIHDMGAGVILAFEDEPASGDLQ